MSQRKKRDISPDIEQDRGLPSAKKPSTPPKIDPLSKIPCAVKSAFFKFWFAGAIFFFLGFGMFFDNVDALDLAVAIGLVMGLVTDIIVNRILDGLDDEYGTMRKYMLFWSPKLYFLGLNLLYGIVLSLTIAGTYTLINMGLVALFSLKAGSVPLGSEPILFGLFWVIYDFILLGARALVMLLIKKIRRFA